MKLFFPRRRPTLVTRELPTQGLLAGRRVLVVDDDLELRRLMRTALELEGAVVSEADGVKRALAAADAGCDVVVTDITMGLSRRDGLRLLARLQASPALAGIPIIAMTGCTALQPELTAAGFARVLIKPFEVLDLPVTIHTLLRGTQVSAA